MTGSPSESNQGYAAAAYARAIDRIELARRLVDAGNDVDLEPIRPAVCHLCEIVKSLPATEAACWLVRLVQLQHALGALGSALAAREADGASRSDQSKEQ